MTIVSLTRLSRRGRLISRITPPSPTRLGVLPDRSPKIERLRRFPARNLAPCGRPPAPPAPSAARQVAAARQRRERPGDDHGRPAPASRRATSSTLPSWTVAGAPVSRIACAQERALPAVALDQIDVGPPAPPGGSRPPAREARPRCRCRASAARPGTAATSCAQSATCRRQISGSVLGATRFSAGCHLREERDERLRAGPTVSRETGTIPSSAEMSSGRRRVTPPGGPPRRLISARISVSAAGVMPSMRAAWPSVAGRTRRSFSRSSFDRPAIAAIVEIVRERRPPRPAAALSMSAVCRSR